MARHKMRQPLLSLGEDSEMAHDPARGAGRGFRNLLDFVQATPPDRGKGEAGDRASRGSGDQRSATGLEEAKMSKNSQHVVPHPDGGWSVKKGGSTQATKRFETQKEAIDYGRKISKAQGSEFYVHGRDGMIRSKDSYGNDPNPPKDRK